MIELRNLYFSYPRKCIYNQVSCEIPMGSITGLLGRNGEGKTTLFKLIAGTIFPQKGELEVLEYLPQRRDAGFLEQVFLLPEEFHCPNIEMMEYFDAVGAFYPRYDRGMAQELLQEFDLAPSMRLGRVSHGQRKKAMITLALSLRVPVLLMDEPTNGLDIPSKSVFRRLMARSVEPQQTVIISTHQVRDLEQIIDRVLMVDQGEFVCNQSVAELSNLFSFGVVTEYNASKALYTEQSIIGNVGVFDRMRFDEDEEGDFSMELFFNAMIAAREEMQAILRTNMAPKANGR
ncbi:MAG: ABC transporter ATP-binding protein [Porphyromonas sp.]|nr:ABC transporter ATP-binding protein [Porphyromonas sp.]